MKSILKKAGIALFAAGALLFASCQNVALNARDDYKESVVKTEKAYLTIKADLGDARTVLPNYSLNDFTSWTVKHGSKTVWTGATYDELKAAVVPVEQGEQTFTLTASKSGTTFSATKTVNVGEGKNSVNFVLKLSQYSTTGTGNANVSVKFKAEGTSAKVATAWYAMNANAPAALTVTDVDVDDGYATVAISKTNVDAGMYYAAFYLYDSTGTVELTHHKELVRIAGDMTSSADVKVDDYSVCDIDWELGFASRKITGLPAALTVPATVAYGTTIELPGDVFGYGAIFTGWKINDETEVTDKTELTVTDDITLTTTWRYRTVKNVKAKAGVTGQIVLEWKDEEEPLPEDNSILHYHSKVRVYEASIFDVDSTITPSGSNSAQVEKDPRYLGEFDSADEKAAINGLEIGKNYKLKVAVITYYDYMDAGVTGFTEGGIDVDGEVEVVQLLESLHIKGNEDDTKRHVVSNAFMKNGLLTGKVGTFAAEINSTVIAKEYKAGTVWELVPGLADPSNPEYFSFRSYADPNVYLYADFNTLYKVEGSGNTNEGGPWVDSGCPVGGVNSWDPNGKSMVISKKDSEITTADAKMAATFKKDAEDAEGYSFIRWAGDTTKIFREYWNTMCVIPDSTSDSQYGKIKFVDYTPKTADALDMTIVPSTADIEKDSMKLVLTITGADADMYGYTHLSYKKGEEDVVVNEAATETVVTGLTAGTEYTFNVTVYDVFGRKVKEINKLKQSTKEDIPVASYVRATAGYTGAITVTWKDFNSTYSYRVSDGTTIKTVAAGVQKAIFTDLEIGSPVTFTVTTMDGETVLDTADSVTATPVKVVWQIAQAYTGDKDDTRYSLYANEGSLDIASCPEVALTGKKYNRWIVMPALDGSDGFSLQASNADGVDTGLYMYVDFTKTNKNFASGGQGDRPHVFIGKLTKTGAAISIANGEGTAITDAAMASFRRGSIKATSCNKALTGFNAPDFDEWRVLKSNYMDENCVDGKYYCFYDTWNRDSVDLSAENRGYNEWNFAVHEEKLTSDEWAGAPNPVSDVTKTSDEYLSITLSWTNPEDKDFDHVDVTLNSVTKTVTGTTATFTGLTAGTEYNYSIVAYDFVGNVSTSVTGAVSTKEQEEIHAVTTVNAVTGYTGQVIVTWEDSGALSYTVSDGTNSKTVEAGVQKAVFNGLTVGTEYTFTVEAEDQPEAETSGSATAIPKVLLWKIANTFEVDKNSVYKAIFAIRDGQDAKGKKFIQTADWDDYLYDAFIVRPSLSNPDDLEQFSLEVSTDAAQKTGYYMTMDSIAYNDDGRVTKGWTWGYGSGNDWHFWAETPDTIVNGNMKTLSVASFKWAGDSTCGVSTDKDTYGKWMTMMVAPGTDKEHYVYDTALVISARKTVDAASGDYAFAYKETVFDAYGEALSAEDIGYLAPDAE